MTCYRGEADAARCTCRRDGLDPKAPTECPYRGLRKRSDDDWSKLLDKKTEGPK